MIDFILQEILTMEEYTLRACTLFLLLKCITHVGLPDGGAFSISGFDAKDGNADTIVYILFLYGSAQAIWLLHNCRALFSKSSEYVSFAVFCHFAQVVIVYVFPQYLWKRIKSFSSHEKGHGSGVIFNEQLPVYDRSTLRKYIYRLELLITGCCVFSRALHLLVGDRREEGDALPIL